MNPILLYPKDEAQAKFFRDTAENNGAKVVNFSEKELEWIDDLLFAQKLVHLDKIAKPVSNEALDDTFDKLLGRK